MNGLIENLDQLHTTEQGIERVKKNLQIQTEDIVQWCRARILDERAEMERRWKNWYITSGDCEITVNAHSYTIITAHKV